MAKEESPEIVAGCLELFIIIKCAILHADRMLFILGEVIGWWHSFRHL